MPSGGHNKGFRNDRKICCARCEQHMCAKEIDDHWKTYENGGKGYPTHKTTSITVKFYELENGKPIKTKSIMSLFGMKDNDESLVISVLLYIQNLTIFYIHN